MKLKKKTVMLLSLTIGTLLFATTALAEVASKSGYDQVKDALKYTAESCSSKLSNYTIDTSFVMKDNDKIVSSMNRVSKYDLDKGAIESKSTSTDYNNKKIESYSYIDKSSSINFNNSESIYYVNEFEKPISIPTFKNPFQEKSAGDLEKIADALIGNLKDYVMVSVKPDGSKEFSGSLSESQIPALVNAVTSFEFKNVFGGYYAARLGVNRDKSANIASDIFVKDVKGNIVIDKNGLIESILGTGTLSGKDDKGIVHTMTFEFLGKLHDVNSTVVKKIDLTGKKVQKSTVNKNVNMPSAKNYSGQYKGDIVIQKDGTLIKIGERIVDIEKSDEHVIAGRYHEEYKKGYEEYVSDNKDFKFEANFEKDPYTNFNYTNSSGKSKQGNISIALPATRLYFFFNEAPKGNIVNDGELLKVFN